MALRSVLELDRATDVALPLDVRGWEVRTAVDDEKAGTVHDVLIDHEGSPIYLDVDLGLLLRRHVLVPVGLVAADSARRVIWVHAMAREGLGHVPEYHHHLDALTPDFEQRVVRSYVWVTRAARRGPPGPHGPAPVARPDPRLTEPARVRHRLLSELRDYRIGDGFADPRGWEVLDSRGSPMGTVEDLVVDPTAMKARYLLVEAGGRHLTGRDSRRVLIPVRVARLDDEKELVHLEAPGREDLEALPSLEGTPDEAYEERVDEHFGRPPRRSHG